MKFTAYDRGLITFFKARKLLQVWGTIEGMPGETQVFFSFVESSNLSPTTFLRPVGQFLTGIYR